MCIPRLERKRVDVQVVGIMSYRGKISAAMSALDGKFGWLLLGHPVSTNDEKVVVYGAGKNGMKHSVPKMYIKPRRVDDDGKSLTNIRARVVIIGPDVNDNAFSQGYYAETQPNLQHSYGADVVGVRLEPSMAPSVAGRPLFFHVSSLSYARNIRIVSPDGIFDTTNFV